MHFNESQLLQSNVNRNNYIQMRNVYNKIHKDAKYKQRVNEGKKLNQIAKIQPRKFSISLKNSYNIKVRNEQKTLK